MKIYTNEIDLAKPILKTFYTAPCSDYKFGVKIVQGKNYVIELNGVELESDGETGGYATYKMTSPNKQGVELFKIKCENGQVAYIKHVTTDSTVFDVDEWGSLEIPTKVSQLDNDSGFITVEDVPTKTSELVNDSNFTTKTELDTVNQNLTTTVTEIQNELNNKATTEYVDNAIGNVLTQEEF